MLKIKWVHLYFTYCFAPWVCAHAVECLLECVLPFRLCAPLWWFLHAQMRIVCELVSLKHFFFFLSKVLVILPSDFADVTLMRMILVYGLAAVIEKRPPKGSITTCLIQNEILGLLRRHRFTRVAGTPK